MKKLLIIICLFISKESMCQEKLFNDTIVTLNSETIANIDITLENGTNIFYSVKNKDKSQIISTSNVMYYSDNGKRVYLRSVPQENKESVVVKPIVAQDQIAAINLKIDDINHRINRFSNNYLIGVGIAAAGSAFAGILAYNGNTTGAIAGAAVSVVGIGFVLSSYMFLKQ